MLSVSLEDDEIVNLLDPFSPGTPLHPLSYESVADEDYDAMSG